MYPQHNSDMIKKEKNPNLKKLFHYTLEYIYTYTYIKDASSWTGGAGM
jgi:hypothetical protein